MNRWGEDQEQRLAAFEKQGQKPTEYQIGVLRALRFACPDQATEHRIDALISRGVRS